jgi:hypothetical protein
MNLRTPWHLMALLVAFCEAPAAEPKLTPRHDPAEQLFRRAPMAESSRSIVVNLASNLHYAFDPDLGRVHTIWSGGPLNLWGPPYSYAKSPFICDFNGPVLFSFPQVSPWWLGNEPLKTRFRAIDITSGEVALAYDLLDGGEPVRVREITRGTGSSNEWTIERTFLFPEGCSRAINLLAFAEHAASARVGGPEAQIVSTNGEFTMTAQSPFTWSTAVEHVSYQTLLITEEGTEKGFQPTGVERDETRVRLQIPANPHAFELKLAMRKGSPLELAGRPRKPQRKTFSGSGELRAPGGDESYKIEYFPLPPEAELLITGMDWLPNGDLAVCTWLGEIYIVRNATGDVRKATYQRFASGLMEPLGLAANNGEIFVVQKGELTKVVDSDRDGVADRFECVNSSWGFSGNYHSFSFGPLVTPQNDFFVFVSGQRGLYDVPYQGWCLKISSDGEKVQPFCSGLRVPHGWGFFGPQNDVFVTDNQGNWIPACRLDHLQRDHFYGFPSSKPAPKTLPRPEDVEPPVLWFPRSLAPSASGFDTIADDAFGPFQGQLLIGDFQNSIVMRAFLEKVNGRWQGVVFPFARSFLSGVNRLKIGPDHRLYVGGGKRVWSTAAPKEFSLDRVSYTGKEPFEIREVHARSDGFELIFTKPVDRKSASEAANYLVKQFTYKYHQEYGSPEFDQAGKIGATETPVAKVELSDNARKAVLQIANLRTGYVTSFQLAVSSAEDEDLRNDTFFYTLNAKPAAR